MDVRELSLTFLNVIIVGSHVGSCFYHWKLIAKVCVSVCVREREREIKSENKYSKTLIEAGRR